MVTVSGGGQKTFIGTPGNSGRPNSVIDPCNCNSLFESWMVVGGGGGACTACGDIELGAAHGAAPGHAGGHEAAPAPTCPAEVTGGGGVAFGWTSL